MAYQRKNGDFILFRNKYKESGDRKPDWKGEILIAGETLDISAWIKTGQNGDFLTGNIQHKRDRAAAKPTEQRQAQPEQPEEKSAAEEAAELPF